MTEGSKSWRITPEGRTELPAAVSAEFAKKADIDGPMVDPARKGISLEYLGIERFDDHTHAFVAESIVMNE
jgi:hypothetical protein